MIKCIAIDDEPLSLALLVDNISKISFLRLEGKFNNAFEAMPILEDSSIDLIFVDIQMPGLTGLQFISSLRNSPMVIFVTAYKKFALDAYELNVVDYLVKPVAIERFVMACNRAKELYDLKNRKPVDTDISQDYFFVHADYSQVKIKYDDIIWMKGYGDYIKFYLKNTEHPLVVRTGFKILETQLPQDKFLRIHKSYMVAIEAITAIRKNSVFLGDKEISIGETYRENINDLLN